MYINIFNKSHLMANMEMWFIIKTSILYLNLFFVGY